MNAQTIKPEPEIAFVPLADLHLSDLNPRQEADPEGIALLAESLLACGLVQNLAGMRDDDGRIGIVAGGRRLRALAIAAEQNPALAMVPVRIAPDRETAAAWASAENIAREALNPADEIRAYGRMQQGGAPVAQIARAFGVPEAHVYRRLKLAALPAPVLDAIRDGKISLAMAGAFTVAQDEEQAKEVLDRLLSYPHYSEHQVRNMLRPSAVRSSDRRAVFVGLDAYREAGGTVTADLFAAETYLDDPKLLDLLFTEALVERAEAIRQVEGWKWAESIPDNTPPYRMFDDFIRVHPEDGDMTEDEAEEYDQLAERKQDEDLSEADAERLAFLSQKMEPVFTARQREHAGLIAYVDNSGELRCTYGLIRNEDRAAAVDAGIVAPNRHALNHEAETGDGDEAAPVPVKSPYSGALVEDMKAIRLAAVQTALLDKTELVLDLLAFGLSMASGVNTTVFDLNPGTPANRPKEADGLTCDERLTHPPRAHEAWSRPELKVDDLPAAFRLFTTQGKKARNAALTAALARLLPYDAGAHWSDKEAPSLFGMIEADTGASIRKVWTPTAANFFGRVSGAYMADLLRFLLDAGSDDARVKSFADKKKKDKAEAMERLFAQAEYQAGLGVTPEQKARIAAWVPDCF